MYRAQAIYQFDGAVPTDLPLKEGEIVTIIGKLPGNLWWEGESADGRIGTFPYNYVNELPPEDDFLEFVGKTGISNFDIIQFVTNDSESQGGKLSILCHVISGDGEYIMEMFHEDFVNLNLLIKERFPLLELPPIPTVEMSREVYKTLIHDYFMFFGIHLMVTPVILKWLKPIPKICVSPCPHWKVSIHTTNIVSEEDEEKMGGKPIISVSRGEHYILLDIEDDYLQLKGETKEGWCSLQYCEIEWMESYQGDESSQLHRIIPFSLPSIQCSDDLRINHITMQTLHMCDRYGKQPVEGDTVMLRVNVYIWNSLRGYMYQFFSTNKGSLLHVIGSEDNSIITELIDHKIQLMHEGEKTMIILHSSTDPPKEVISFLEGCISFYLCYIIDLRFVKRVGDERVLETMLLSVPKSSMKPVKPEKPPKPDYLNRELAYSIKSLSDGKCEGDELSLKECGVKDPESVKKDQPHEGGDDFQILADNPPSIPAPEVPSIVPCETPSETPSEIPSETPVTDPISVVVENPSENQLSKKSSSHEYKPSIKPQLPPKPSRDILSTKMGVRPELPPKPAHITKASHTLSMRVPPPKPTKPAKMSKLAKHPKPEKPIKPWRTSPVTSSDSHDTHLSERHVQSSSTESILSVRSPVPKE